MNVFTSVAVRERNRTRRLLVLEGVEYHRFVIRFALADGRRRRWIRWSPAGGAWVREELIRELVARDIRPEDLKPRSCTIAESEDA